jgi:hypothetical protein
MKMKINQTKLFTVAVGLGFSMTAFGNPTWTFYDLGQSVSFSGMRRTSTMATGYIVGESNSAYVYWTYSSGVVNGPYAIPLMPSSPMNLGVYDVSALGTIVGYGEIEGSSSYPAGFSWNIVSHPTAATNIGELIFPYSINNNDVIAGWNDNKNMGYINGATVPSPYGPTPGTFPGFNCVNDYINGVCTTPYTGPSGYTYGSIYVAGSNPHNIGPLAGNWYKISPLQTPAPLVINNADNLLNQITNTYGNGQGTVGIWSSPDQTYVGVADADHTTHAFWMNQSDDVTGSFNLVSPPTMPHAFWWSVSLGQIDLNSTTYVTNLNTTTTTLIVGDKISDHGTGNVGDIVGECTVVVNHAPQTHAFLLIAN